MGEASQMFQKKMEYLHNIMFSQIFCFSCLIIHLNVRPLLTEKHIL